MDSGGRWQSWRDVSVLLLVAVDRPALDLPEKKPSILIYDSLKKKFTAFMMSLIHAFNDIKGLDYCIKKRSESSLVSFALSIF